MAQKHQLQIYLAPLLLPLSWIFGGIARLRSFLYQKGICKSYTPKLPCICVGNISWGGTGKSPLIDYLLKRFQADNIHCAVLTRGYGAKLAHYPFILNKDFLDKHASGLKDMELPKNMALPDEPCMLLQKNPHSTIVIDPKRVESAKLIEKDFPQIKVLLMDDGFQHFTIRRTMDFVLLDYDDLNPHSSFAKANWNTCIPLGSWREPKSSLHRAAAFFLKCPPADWNTLKEHAAKKLSPYQKPLFIFTIKINALKPLFSKEQTTPSAIKDYALLAGIGNPLQFQKSVQEYTGKTCIKTIFLDDHANMDAHIAEILDLDMPIICTEKDAAKLKNYTELAQTEIYYTQTSVEFYASCFTTENFDTWFSRTVLPLIKQ